MKIYKVRIQIEEVDKDRNHCLKLGTAYEAGKFKTDIGARKFVENELMVIRAINTKLRNACQSALKFLNSLPQRNLMTTLENLASCRRRLKEAISYNTLAIDDSCPKCGAGSDERELTGKDFIGIEAIHMHYICKKCGSEIIEEFTLTDVFIDK